MTNSYVLCDCTCVIFGGNGLSKHESHVKKEKQTFLMTVIM